MSEGLGVLIAIVSSFLGGTAAAITRYLVGSADPLTIALLRWGIGVLCVLPVALLLRVRWPSRKDWPAVALLGFCFFGVFFIFYNVAIGYTTAARASLALSTLPLQTMVVAAVLGVERLTGRKSLGVGIAMLGVFGALASGLAAAPAGAWKGELIMIGAVLCMSVYNVLSRPFIQRSSALGFLSVGMGAGALALQRASPTRVANTMTVNPIAAALLAHQLVGEPITLNLVLGLVAVFAGIWLATTEAKSA